MTYDFSFYETVQDKVEAFDSLCEAMGWQYGDINWSRLYRQVSKGNPLLEEAILQYQQSEFSRVTA